MIRVVERVLILGPVGSQAGGGEEREDVDQQARVAGLFDRLASTYDSLGVGFFRPIAAGLLAEVAPSPGERALDIGCGRGAVLFSLADAVGPAGSVTGIDVSPAMIEATAADAAKAGLTVDLRVGDAMNPDLPAASFDLVTSSLVLFFLPDPLAALRRWRVLLAPGGRIGVTTFGPYSERWRDQVDNVLRAFAPDGVADPRTTGQQGPFASDEGMEKLLSAAGFDDVRTVTATV
jgi:ubiquinone/menaquinone biosynthesis C-methylase UbiE